jgi:hypothetical protein
MMSQHRDVVAHAIDPRVAAQRLRSSIIMTAALVVIAFMVQYARG